MDYKRRLAEMIETRNFDEVLDAVARMKRYYDNPVYVEALDMYIKTQSAQIEKGMKKYPEPLNHSSWSIDELAQHAFDELVDQSHYIKALQFKGKQLEGQVEHFKSICKTHGKMIADLGNEIRTLENDRNRLKKDCREYAETLDRDRECLEKAAKQIGELTTHSYTQTKDIERLDEELRKRDIMIDELRHIVANQKEQLQRRGGKNV